MLVLAAVAGLLLVPPFGAALGEMYTVWMARPEYSHGILLPLVAAFLVWQKREQLESAPFVGSWWGLALLLGGGALAVLGELSTLYVIAQYGFLLVVYGLVLALVGWQVFRSLWVPLLILALMIPLPNFILNNLSAELQLISSQIGVAFIRAAGISVFLEGNVIDLGSYKLQVAEACDGLRYLFPLFTLGFVMAYFFRAPLWARALLVFSSIPITILMNSFRVGTIGIMVEHWGIAMAEGFLHEFQGWVVFMASGAVMLAGMWLLARLQRPRRPFRDVFGIDLPVAPPADARRVHQPVPPPFAAAVGMVAVIAVAGVLLPNRAELTPSRDSLVSFPTTLESWEGRRGTIESVYLDQLQLDDYLLVDYFREASAPVNLYVAWYDSQRSGESAHSPRSCIPGGGWQIVRHAEHEVPLANGTIRVNRALIQYGERRQLVYYWFAQRGRVITNEYAAKWYLFWDALTRRRTDGALVRVTMPLARDVAEEAADAELAEFLRAAVPTLAPFVPG